MFPVSRSRSRFRSKSSAVSAGDLWTPAQLTTALWLDAADAGTVVLNGSTVSQWNDKSGNSRNATQATATNQPTYTASWLNAKPALTFDGVNDFLSFQGVHDAQWSIAITARALSDRRGFVQFGGLNQFGNLFVEGFYTARPANTTGATAPFTAGENVVLTTTYGATQTDIWKNGVIGTPSAASGVASNANSRIGILGTFFPLDGQIGEIIALNGVLSTDNRQKLEGYLAWKWGGV